RRKVARRAINDLQDFGHRGLLSLGLVALDGPFIKPSLQLGVSPPKFCYLVIERRAHVLTPSRPCSRPDDTSIDTRSSREGRTSRSPSRRKRQVRLDVRVFWRSDRLKTHRDAPGGSAAHSIADDRVPRWVRGLAYQAGRSMRGTGRPSSKLTLTAKSYRSMST